MLSRREEREKVTMYAPLWCVYRHFFVSPFETSIYRHFLVSHLHIKYGNLANLEGRIEKVKGRNENLEGRIEKVKGRNENVEGRIERVEGWKERKRVITRAATCHFSFLARDTRRALSFMSFSFVLGGLCFWVVGRRKVNNNTPKRHVMYKRHYEHLIYYKKGWDQVKDCEIIAIRGIRRPAKKDVIVGYL